MLPMVTGIRFEKNPAQVSSEKSSGVFPIDVQNESGAPILIKSPIGMK
jgi:hypothetical protein